MSFRQDDFFFLNVKNWEDLNIKDYPILDKTGLVPFLVSMAVFYFVGVGVIVCDCIT